MEARYKPRVAQDWNSSTRTSPRISDNLQKNSGKLTPQAEATMTADGQRKQREAQRLQEDLQADVERERNEILGPRPARRCRKWSSKVAEAKGLDLVVDVPYAVYFKAALEITTEVIAAYDKAYPAAAPTAAK